MTDPLDRCVELGNSMTPMSVPVRETGFGTHPFSENIADAYQATMWQ